ncbi:MAG: sigma-70 family RNA polymerase sigma factor [Oscillospiraceae bacterium]|nr:sigma-70 family RNA polymerase sigma factor [Oscillospiraceae bacterium]
MQPPNSSSFTDLPDAKLAVLAAHGNQLAFEEVVLRYVRLVASIASKYRSDSFEINDFIQEGLLALHSACKTYAPKGGASFKNFAARCIENRFISIIRSANKKSAIPHGSTVSIDDIELSDQNSTNPEQIFALNGEKDDIFSEFEKKLSPLERKVFKLYINGSRYNEIADLLKITEKSADNALQRIKKKLSFKP